MSDKRRVLTVFLLTMINVSTILSLRSLPISSGYGWGLLFVYALATLTFFLPLGLIAAELATTYPKAGGVYIWVEEALGSRFGFLAIWMLFIENIVWFPMMLSFLATLISYFIDPALASNKFYTVTVILTVFWGATLLNLFGMEISGWVSTLGVLIGTILPGILIIVLGFIWYSQGRPLALEGSSFIPSWNLPNLVFISGVLLGLAGIEMPAVHAREVKDPQKTFPKSILFASIIIFVLFSLGSLSIAFIVPADQIVLVSGLMDTFAHFFKAYHLEAFTPLLAILITLGALAQVCTWAIGPSKGLYATVQHGILPPIFHRVNKKKVPVAVLLLQGLIVTLLAFTILFMPSVNSAYWILMALTSQAYLTLYFFLFISVVVLRFKKPNLERPFKVPGGKIGLIFVALLAFSSSLFSFVLGFIPPEQIEHTNIWIYEFFLVGALIVLGSIPLILYRYRKPHWKLQVHEHF